MHQVWLDNPAPSGIDKPSVTWFRQVEGNLVSALKDITRTFEGVNTAGNSEAHGKLPPCRVSSTSPNLANLLAEHYTFGDGERMGPSGPLPANTCVVVEPDELHQEYLAIQSGADETPDIGDSEVQTIGTGDVATISEVLS